MNSKRLMVIGAGPGGFTAALEAAASRWSVTLINDGPLGGACTNRGCIPSKYFLTRAKQTAEALALKNNGVEFRLEKIRMRALTEGKDAVVDTLRSRMQQALKAGKIRFLQGRAQLTGTHAAQIITSGASERVEADAVILASGSSPVIPKRFPTHSAIFTSDTLFDISYLPAHLVVVGGGYIGAELACAFQGLGSKVTLIEKEPRLFPSQLEFESASALMIRLFEKRGMTVWTGTEVEHISPISDQHVQLRCSNGQTLDANAVLLAIGRRPALDTLGLENAGVKVENGRILVNAARQTSSPHIYAIGDLASALPLAHTASHEAHVAIEHLNGHAVTLDYSRIPKVVYTWPEMAAVGLTEKEALAKGITPRLDRYHVLANSKALVEGEPEGVWLIVSDSLTRKILGGQIVGPHATELIHMISLAIQGGLTTTDVASTVFAHPTLAEGFGELMIRSAASTKSAPSSS